VPYLFVGKSELRGSLKQEYMAVILPKELVENYKHVIFQAHMYAFTGDSLDVPFAQAEIYTGRLFNESGEVVKEINSVATVDVRYCPRQSLRGITPVIISDEYCIDITSVAGGFELPLGYYLEVLLFSLIVRIESLGQRKYVVYPFEFKYNLEGAPDKIRVIVESYASSLKRVATLLELPIVLAKIGLEGLSADLVEGLKRFYSGDYEGSIKFFRKVVEGLRNHVREKPVFGSKRDELLHGYLSKLFQLISNFGEHANTRGSVYEAEFSMEVCLSAVKYIARYLLSGSPGAASGRVP
jgi:hypothetical protein